VIGYSGVKVKDISVAKPATARRKDYAWVLGKVLSSGGQNLI